MPPYNFDPFLARDLNNKWIINERGTCDETKIRTLSLRLHTKIPHGHANAVHSLSLALPQSLKGRLRRIGIYRSFRMKATPCELLTDLSPCVVV